MASAEDQTDARLAALREVILATAAETDGVGPLEETLRWGQTTFLTTVSKSGTMVRIDRAKADPHSVVLFVHCQTDLVAKWRDLYPDAFAYEGSRALVLSPDQAIDTPALRHCIALALTYRRRKKGR